MSLNLFIDTNIFLSFYHLTSDDLNELNKLTALLQRNELLLYLPDQVSSEFDRNRERRISDALKELGKHRFSFPFPQMCSEYEEYNHFRDKLRECNRAHRLLVDRFRDEIATQQLAADRRIREVFDSARTVDTTSESIKLARIRSEVGNPPGKVNSIGDSVNWELLLANVPDAQDLYLISDDRDFKSRLKDDRINPFLAEEWMRKKNSEIHFYTRLSGFFKEKYPEIHLSGDLEKDLCIRDFANSPNFATTHEAVAKLRAFGNEFSSAQLNAIVNGVLSNSQVYWIIGDSDVRDFVSDLIRGRADEINESSLEIIRGYLDESDPREGKKSEVTYSDDDLPF